jgi:hypothetical protein
MICNYSVCGSLISVGMPEEFRLPSTGSRFSLVDGTSNVVERTK